VLQPAEDRPALPGGLVDAEAIVLLDLGETDAAAATMGGDKPSYDGLLYLVTSVRKGVVDDHKLFAWDPASEKFVEAPMEITSSQGAAE